MGGLAGAGHAGDGGQPLLENNDVASHAIGLPYEGLVSPERTTHDTHLSRNHEARVEADAKLADDVDVLALVLRVGLPKLLGAGVGDGTEVLVELLLRKI